ncbi:MAG: hypothetical protein RL017_85, partial [Pseudomonadota bacterium]
MQENIKQNNKTAIVAIFFSITAIIIVFGALMIGNNLMLQSDAENKSLETQILSLKQKNMMLTSTVESKFVYLNDQLKQFHDANLNIIFYQINEMVNLANQSIVIYNDVPGAIRLLTKLQIILNNSDNPIFVGIKYAIASDLTKLNSVNLVDKTYLNGQLASLEQQFHSMQLNIIAAKPVVVNQDKSHSAWHKFLSNMQSALLSMVTITKTSVNGVALPKDQDIILVNIQLDLLNAKLALLQNNVKQWQNSLNDISNSLHNSFIQYQSIAQLIKQVDNLEQINIAID